VGWLPSQLAKIECSKHLTALMASESEAAARSLDTSAAAVVGPVAAEGAGASAGTGAGVGVSAASAAVATAGEDGGDTQDAGAEAEKKVRRD